jgi:tRNA(fMet)-specific endonuclease VapC
VSGKLALDANAYVDAANGVPAILQALDDADQVFVPSIVVGEILFGALNSGRPSENIHKADRFIGDCVILPIDENRRAPLRADTLVP